MNSSEFVKFVALQPGFTNLAEFIEFLNSKFEIFEKIEKKSRKICNKKLE
jgi:hypothetical protein